MAPHRSRVLAAAAVCALAGVCTTPRAAAGTLPPVADTARPGSPGPLNALTDVPGLRVGQVQSTRPPYATGTTVVHAPGGAEAQEVHLQIWVLARLVAVLRGIV